MYVAAARIAETFGCDVIGIQYQQGLKDLMPASDLVEGMLNNADRPPVMTVDGKPIREGRRLSHFNEVDECAGLDALFTNRVHRALGQPVETTLHDLRWGDPDRSGTTKDYVWVLPDFRRRAARPPHRRLGRVGLACASRRCTSAFGGGTVRGIAKPGEIVWSRIFVEAGKLKMDLGRAHVVELPKEETERRWKATTPQWPIMHAVTAWRQPRPDDGTPQGQPHPGRLRQFRQGSRPGDGRQGCAGRGAGSRSVAVRRQTERVAAASLRRADLGRPANGRFGLSKTQLRRRSTRA